MATAASLVAALANSTSPLGAEALPGVAEQREPRRFRLELVAREGDRLLGEEADQDGADRHQEERRERAQRLAEDGGGEAGAAGAEELALSRSGWATKTIRTEAAWATAKAPTVATTASSPR